MIKTVFFDLDGVLAKFKQMSIKDYLMYKLNIYIPPYYDYFMGLDKSEIVKDIIETDPDNFFKDIILIHTDRIAEQLLEFGINAAILSNRPASHAKFLNTLRGEKDLPIICIGDTPKIIFIQNYIKELGVAIDEVLLIEDNPHTDKWRAIGLNVAIIRNAYTQYYVDTYPSRIKYLIKHPIYDLIETINKIEEDNK
jgi:FMN phosphatase YigB (HAD superfamily)